MTNEDLIENLQAGGIDINQALDQARKDEAVEFRVWCRQNEIGNQYTTEELYQLFKQSKQ